VMNITEPTGQPKGNMRIALSMYLYRLARQRMNPCIDW
jgi:hypothetical protein